MVGLIKGVDYVGYYTAATKLSHMALALVTSLGTVMLPRMSSLIKENNYQEFNRLTSKAYNFSIVMSVATSLGIIVLAGPLIRLFGGENFIPSITTLRIISPIIIFIGLSNLFGMQILYPLGKIRIVIWSVSVGAIVNFTLNLLLIPILDHNGAAIATVIAELSVVVTQVIMAKEFIPFKLYNSNVLQVIVSSLIMFTVCYGILHMTNYSDLITTLIVVFCGFVVFLVSLLLLKNAFATEYLGKFLHFTKTKK